MNFTVLLLFILALVILLCIIIWIWLYYYNTDRLTVFDKLLYDKQNPDKLNWTTSKWQTDVVELGNVCVHFQKAMSHEYSDDVFKEATTFIRQYQNKVSTFTKVPYGNNWYQHSVSLPLFLAQYIYYCTVLKKPDEVKANAAKLILSLIQTPKLSLGAKRNSVNSIYMAYPWIVAHHALGTYETASKHEDYQYALDQARFKPVESGEGYYKDGGFITHTNVVSYGYLYDVFKIAKQLYQIEDLYEGLDALYTYQSIFLNPDNTYVGFNCVNRQRLTTQVPLTPNFKVEYGLKTIPSINFMRFFTKNYVFSMRGQLPHIAFSESDKTHDSQSQYIDYRNIIYNGKFDPNDRMGMVFNITNTDFKLVKIQTTRTTTTSFLPKSANSTLELISPTKCKLTQHTYIPEFGEYERDESIEINADEEIIKIDIKITAKNTDKFVICLNDKIKRMSDDSNILVCQIVHNKGVTTTN